MKILIVGGGIASITLAHLLQKKHQITIVEKGSTWRTIGYGVGIWKNGLDLLKRLSLDQSFWDSGYPVRQGATLSSKGKIQFQMSFETDEKDKPIAVTFEREILHEAIHKKLENVAVKFNTTIKSITQLNSEAEAEFENGTKEKFDLIVGADGVRSTVRSLIFGDKLKSYGWNIWGAWVPPNTQPFPGYYIFGGPKESVLSFSYHGKHAIGLMYKAEPNEKSALPESREILLNKFPLLKEQIGDMVSAISDISVMFHDRLQYVEMKEWYKGNIVLIGDARHSMSPLTGLGTSLALEDAFVLAEEINSNTDINTALGNFTSRRNKRLKSVEVFRKIIERIGMINSPFGEMLRNVALRLMPRSLPNYLFEKIFNTKI
jgi:2-polyprenyl-6-methoxyphenol hydroxylase-like FAD-dependent oxidoreductase